MDTTGFARIAKSRAGEATTALQDLRAGRLDAVVLHEVLSGDQAGALVEALERNADDFERTSFPGPFRSHFMGRNLNLEDPGLGAYFEAEQAFRGSFRSLGARVGIDLEAHICAILAAADPGVQYSPAPGPDPGTRYFFTTAREHLPGGYIPAHFDNEQASRPSYRHLAPLIDGDIHSFVLTLSSAEAGGHLELIDIRAGEQGERFAADDRVRRSGHLEGVRTQPIDVPPGTLVAVASGRLLHRVTPVEGDRTRWTLCSFLGSSRDSGSVLCWG